MQRQAQRPISNALHAQACHRGGNPLNRMCSFGSLHRELKHKSHFEFDRVFGQTAHRYFEQGIQSRIDESSMPRR